MRFRERSNTEQAVDISPLIDMVFILLIFFMVSTTFVKDMKLDLERPSATTSEQASTKAIRLYIDNSGETWLDGQPIRTWVIQSKLRDMLQGAASQSVLVVTDSNVPASKLVEVVDQARRSGAADVGVATVEEAGRG
ncbi:biopolymer transporter ExbD [Wenzhouxiangella sp. XN201]|uniref:ExbD/TolR family protein n=1 Tax=Wenzhouxiangella sp. XN201 TaxID=2710755 RepID=UPI0013C9E15A|nr:biopolymer transporter ExbD [Wenzhouxiangella sp. XN201]NEZ03934.1 biopolymer transporter ExbD [Wenzhouxiangella sp. XN201]